MSTTITRTSKAESIAILVLAGACILGAVFFAGKSSAQPNLGGSTVGVCKITSGTPDSNIGAK